jgi:GT2 family glycosyltransferase
MTPASVAIIVLNWNNYSETIECLNSLERITYPRYEIILVDNGSTDRSEEILRERFPRLTILQTGKNLGFSGGNNLGIRSALEKEHSYILLLNNDTLVEPEFLNSMVQQAEGDPAIGLVGPRILYNDKRGIVWFAGGSLPWWRAGGFHDGFGADDNVRWRTVHDTEFLTGCALLIRREVFYRVGFLDEDFFLYCEDVDYCYRVKKADYRLLFDGRSTIYHRVSNTTGGMMSSISLRYTFRNRLLFAKKNLSLLQYVVALGYVSATVASKCCLWVLFGHLADAKAIAAGLCDYWASRVGKIEELA